MSRRRGKKSGSSASHPSASASASTSQDPPPPKREKKKDGAVKKTVHAPVAAGVPGWFQWIVIILIVLAVAWWKLGASNVRRQPRGGSLRTSKRASKSSKNKKKEKSQPKKAKGPMELGFHSDCGKGFNIDRFQVHSASYGQGDTAGWKTYDRTGDPWYCKASNPDSKKGQTLKCSAQAGNYGFEFVSRGTGKQVELISFKMDDINMVVDKDTAKYGFQSSNTVGNFHRNLQDKFFSFTVPRPGKSHTYAFRNGDDILKIDIEASCPFVILTEKKEKASPEDATSQ